MNEWKIPSWDELFMRHVYLIASKSKDTKTKIGAVIVKDNAIISEGYNGMCRGVDDNIEERYERPEKYFWFEHAERNAIYHCARSGIRLEGSTLYTQGLPCTDCTRAIIQCGIQTLVLHEEYEHGLMGVISNISGWRDGTSRSDIMLFETKFKIRMFSGKLNVQTMVDGKIYNV